MDGWDDNMQSQCADSFCKPHVIRSMNEANLLKLMDESLNIIVNADINNEAVSNFLTKILLKL